MNEPVTVRLTISEEEYAQRKDDERRRRFEVHSLPSEPDPDLSRDAVELRMWGCHFCGRLARQPFDCLHSRVALDG